MNVKGFLLLALFAALAALPPSSGLAAQSDPIVHDSSVPPERQCTLMLSATLTVTSFDGEEVRWTSQGVKNWATIKIPDGPHDFVLDYLRGVSVWGPDHTAKALKFRHEDFIAGHTYRMWAAEGAEDKGFAGMFDDIVGTMVDTLNRKLTIVVDDITEEK
jgi:hypothetical protein